jgi:hypothetical protein
MFGGASGQQARSLAQLIIDSNNNNIKAYGQIEGTYLSRQDVDVIECTIVAQTILIVLSRAINVLPNECEIRLLCGLMSIRNLAVRLDEMQISCITVLATASREASLAR